MAISTFPNSRHLKYADMFFFLDEEDILKVYILKNVPLIGTSEKEMLDKGIKLLELGFGTCEWLIDINQQLPVYINKRYYRNHFVKPEAQGKLSCFGLARDDRIYSNISGRHSAFNEEPQMGIRIAGTYVFDLLVTDMSDEYSKVEIITGLTIMADSYESAMSEVREWIERNYSNFKELEWFIKERGKMQVYNISITDFLDKRDCRKTQMSAKYNQSELV